MEISQICVVGAGTMGHGIAQVAASAGYPVTMHDIEDRFLQRGIANIQASLARLVKSDRLREGDAASILGRISITTDLETAARDADLVVEAAPELLDLKQVLFRQLDAICQPEAILASNTSQLSITAIAATTQRPDKVVGMHWFNPPQVMRLVEIARGLDTSEQTIAAIRDISAKMGKETVVCKDSQGFITTRAIAAFLLECARILEEGIATKEDIDKAVKLAFNHPMGPFELMDLTGIDVNYHASSALCMVLGERFRAPQSLRQLMAAGHLGRKTGKGFHDHARK